jgi:alpha-L-arabinofuranosidase
MRWVIPICLILLTVLKAEADMPALKLSPQAGRISPMLFGGFVELLDDLVPGMWAEMLNDRSFEGLTKPSSWCYYEGAPNFCDREWVGADYDTGNPFNGSRSAKLGSSLTQSGLAVRKSMTYEFSGYFRGDAQAEVVLKALLPDGGWMELASARLPKPTDRWKKYTAKLTAKGTTDRAVFEIRAIGKGDLWLDKLCLMPSDSIDGWRKDVVEAIKDAHPSIIRWGGSVCDPGGYRWKNGVGDRDVRVPFPNKVWGRIDSNDVGIDEFCRFCQLVGAEPLICISFSDGPQSAADLVQYCNAGAENEWGAKRAANGHPKPYNVKYWQLGNELGNADYVIALPEFCKAMKRADPKAILMASFPSQEMIDKAGKGLDYICPHHYTPDFAACEADFEKLEGMLKGTDIKIAVTEWNSTAGDWGLGRGKLMTLGGALLNARYLNLLMRHSDMVDIACRSNMTNSLCSGMIETNAVGLLKRPSYYVMKLYADHAKSIPLAVENAPEGVDVFACKDGKSLCIFAVNMKTEPVELDLGDLDPISGEVVRDNDNRGQADIMNHWDAPFRVRTNKLDIADSKITLPPLSASAIECRD